jgi:hypothetical protein
VQFTGQSNIVVWDEAHKTEHFMRDARFDTEASDLGFLAPTPTRPTLSKAEKAAFTMLNALSPLPVEMKGGTAPLARAPRVRVIEVTDVAGYRATVLKATDAKALAKWLKENGYGSPKWLSGWLEPYVRRSWYLTAFKVNGSGTASTGPVRMSFKTDRPFNPYSVPAANSAKATLQVLYVSAGNEVPRIGGSRDWVKPLWRAPLPETTRVKLARALHLPSDSIPRNAKVVAYVDSRFSQPNQDDLYFVAPTRRVTSGAFYAIGAGLGVVGFAAAVRARSRGRNGPL